eukprot:g8583.t1
MPRLGDDQNMATAYPERVNLRGSWMRQLLYTMVATLVMYKIVFTDYRKETKESMIKKGLSEEAQERILPKTAAEKRREIAFTKMTQAGKIQALTFEVGNLTNAVIELQKLAADHYGVTVEHPITLGEKEKGDEDAAEGDEAQPDGAGGDQGGTPPTVNLRGVGEDGGSPDAGGDGDGYGGSGVAADADGDNARRLGRAAGEGEPAALRGGSAGPRQLEGSPLGDG